MSITVQIATLPDREVMLWQTVKSLYQQADAFYIMLNGHKEEPRIPDPSDKIRYEIQIIWRCSKVPPFNKGRLCI